METMTSGTLNVALFGNGERAVQVFFSCSYRLKPITDCPLSSDPFEGLIHAEILQLSLLDRQLCRTKTGILIADNLFYFL